jgi:NAD(P) transhydrogenase
VLIVVGTHGLCSQRRSREYVWKYRSQSVRTYATSASAPSQVPVVPYSSLTVGVPREIYPNERRVALTPQNVALLLKKGFVRVLVERGAGDGAQLLDQAYEKAGATLVDQATVWSESNIVLKVRGPQLNGPFNEVEALKPGSTIISFLYPAQNRQLVDKLAARGANSFAIDMIPRISRAQVFDALRYGIYPHSTTRLT